MLLWNKSIWMAKAGDKKVRPMRYIEVDDSTEYDKDKLVEVKEEVKERVQDKNDRTVVDKDNKKFKKHYNTEDD